MGGTKENSKRKRRSPRLFSSVVVVVVAPAIASGSSTTQIGIPIVEAFIPASRRRTGGFTRQRPSFVGPVTKKDLALAIVSTTSPESDGTEKETEDKNNTGDNIIVHQRIKEADPEWYREYVSDLLGEDYCSDRWPVVDLSRLEPNYEAEVEDTIVASEKMEEDPEELLLQKPVTAEEIGDVPQYQPDKIEEESSDREEEEGEGKKPEFDITAEEDVEENAEGVVVNDEKITKDLVVEDNESEEDMKTPLESKSSSARVVAQDVENAIETPTVVDQIDVVKSLPTEAEPASDKSKTKQNDEGIATSDKTELLQADPSALTSNDPRALVYRSITGQAMTCVPLADLLALGYTVSDLERIQAEFLSIVVLDRQRCPSMGIPSQWKVKNPRAEAETTIVSSIEEATTLVNQINEEEQTKRDSINQRRRRQEVRQRKPGDQRQEMPPMGATSNLNVDKDSMRRSDRRDSDRTIARSGRRRPVRGAQGRPEDGYEEPQRRRRSESRRGDPPSPRRDRRRRDRDWDSDETPRKIYRVPRDDTRRKKDDGPDPPDPNSPIWVNMDTFRDLLQKEADFRLNFLGDDWSDIIDEENDWRMGLYRSWLWSLNNGVGESIVPPSRYERARRRQKNRIQRDPQQARPRPRPSQESSPQEGRRRRQREARPPSFESRPPSRDGDPRSRQQRRPLMDEQDLSGADKGFKNNSADEMDDPVGDGQLSSAQRRSRRRAERRRRAPPDS